MQRDEIIRIAREAGIEFDERINEFREPGLDGIEMPAMLALVALVAAAEREECAKVAESLWHIDGTASAKEFADTIRARAAT